MHIITWIPPFMGQKNPLSGLLHAAPAAQLGTWALRRRNLQTTNIFRAPGSNRPSDEISRMEEDLDFLRKKQTKHDHYN